MTTKELTALMLTMADNDAVEELVELWTGRDESIATLLCAAAYLASTEISRMGGAEKDRKTTRDVFVCMLDAALTFDNRSTIQ